MKYVLAFLLTASLLLSSTASAETTRSDNLSAFARIVGYVQYFHPTDTARTLDWDKFTMAHLESVEAATTPEDLAATLNRLFAPYAPTMRVTVTGETPNLPIPDISAAREVRQWVHVPITNGGNSLRMASPTLARQPIENGDFERSFSLQRTMRLGGYVSMDVPLFDPRDPFVVDLAAGVTLHMPLAVFSDGEQTLPIAPPAPPLPETDDERASYLASTIYAWNMLQHFFVYWDTIEAERGTDWLALLPGVLDEAANATSEYDLYQALQRLAANLHDGHTAVFPDPLQRSEWIERGWLPSNNWLPFTWDLIEGQLTITSVFEGSPLALGDVVLAVDGVTPADHIAEQRLYQAGVNEYAAYRILGDWLNVSESVTLTVQRYGSDTEETVVVAPSDDNLSQRVDYWHREPRPETFAHLGQGIYYLDLTRLEDLDFNQNARVIEANARALIVDMRGYPNGRSAIRTLGAIAGRNLSSAPFLIGVTVEPDHRNFLFEDITSDRWITAEDYDFPEDVIFLTNSNGAISYAESIMGIVEGYELGPILGSRTAGANGNVVILYLPNGFRISFTSLMVKRFDGSPLMTVGVQPTQPLERTRAGVAAGRDEWLEAAFTQLGGEALIRMNDSE